MEGEEDPVHVDIKLALQTINTHGTEITPGSDEIGEDSKLGLTHKGGACRVFEDELISTLSLLYISAQTTRSVRNSMRCPRYTVLHRAIG